MKLSSDQKYTSFVRLLHSSGTLEKGSSFTGRDCFRLKTELGEYTSPTYARPWAPCDTITFQAVNEKEIATDREVLKIAEADAQFAGLLAGLGALVDMQNLAAEQLEALVRKHGSLVKGGNPAGRDCYVLKSKGGRYLVRTYETVAAPCDTSAFESEQGELEIGGHAMLLVARKDELIAELLRLALHE